MYVRVAKNNLKYRDCAESFIFYFFKLDGNEIQIFQLKYFLQEV